MGTISLTSSPPKTLMPVEGGLVWVFEFTPVNNDTQIERAVIFINDVDGAAYVKSVPFIIDKAGTITLDLQDIMSSFVYTTIPDLTWGATVQEDTTIVFEMSIDYGIQTVTMGDTCDTNTVIEGTTDNVKVINAGVPLYQDNDFIYVKGQIYNETIWLTNRPRVVELAEHTYDYIWGYHDSSSDGLDLEARLYDNDGTLVGTINKAKAGADTVSIFPASFAALGTSSDVVRIDLYWDKGLSNYEYLYRVVKKRGCTEEDLVDISFLEPKGGFAVMSFDTVEEIHSVVSYNEIEQLIDYNASIPVQRTTGGKSIINNEGYYRFTLKKTFQNRIDRKDWINNFYNAPLKFIKRVNSIGASYLIKFLTLPNTYKVYTRGKEEALIVTGYYHVNNASQSER